jgi:hypothetical protein
MEKKIIVNELQRQVRKNFDRRKVVQKGIDDLYQADLVEMISYFSENKNYKYILTVICTFSKFAFGVPLKSKRGIEIVSAFEKIFSTGRICKNLQTDSGTEFYNHHFKEFLKKYSVNHYSTFTIMKASTVERFNRTIKNKLWRQFSLQGSYKWLKILPKLIKEYNNTFHRTIQMTPSQVNIRNEKHILSTIYNKKSPLKKTKRKFNNGDFCRISKYKHLFDKGFNPNWTTEIFRIVNINNTSPVTYLIEDLENNQIKGCFYEQELQKTQYPNNYLVEKIITKKKDKYFVKWLGFPEEKNSWINKKDLF